MTMTRTWPMKFRLTGKGALTHMDLKHYHALKHSSLAANVGDWLKSEIVEPADGSVTALAEQFGVSREALSIINIEQVVDCPCLGGAETQGFDQKDENRSRMPR